MKSYTFIIVLIAALFQIGCSQDQEAPPETILVQDISPAVQNELAAIYVPVDSGEMLSYATAPAKAIPTLWYYVVLLYKSPVQVPVVFDDQEALPTPAGTVTVQTVKSLRVWKKHAGKPTRDFLDKLIADQDTAGVYLETVSIKAYQ